MMSDQEEEIATLAEGFRAVLNREMDERMGLRSNSVIEACMAIVGTTIAMCPPSERLKNYAWALRALQSVSPENIEGLMPEVFNVQTH
jgi:hypothetical protein